MRRLLTLAALTFASTTAHADITAVEGADGVSFLATVQGMTDLDQSRDPASWGPERRQGAMYCGPTAGANVLNYFAREGFPEIDPGDVDLEPETTAGVTGRERTARLVGNALKVRLGDGLIADVADAMETDPVNGTDISGMVDGLRVMLPDDFTITREGQKECRNLGNYDITNPRKIFDHLEAGHIVIVRFGYYQPNAAGTRYTRQGGHWVVPTTIYRYQDFRRLSWADSARDDGGRTGSNTTQSSFVNETSEIEKVWVDTGDCGRNRWQVLSRTSNSGDPAFIEDMVVIAPPGT
ncbi:MAG: hypothetical protein ACE366_17340 [Bradymonadia bacterium]